MHKIIRRRKKGVKKGQKEGDMPFLGIREPSVHSWSGLGGPPFHLPFLGPHTLVKDIPILSLPDCKTAWPCLGMELPACALGVKGKGIVVRQPLPSVLPQPLLHELAVSSQASRVKNPSIQRQEKKKLKLIFTSFNFGSYSWHERVWKDLGG